MGRQGSCSVISEIMMYMEIYTVTWIVICMHVYPCHNDYMTLVTHFCTFMIIGMFVWCGFR